MLNLRSILCIVPLVMPLSCLAQSITLDQLLYSGTPDPEVQVTNSTSPNISTIESYLQNLPVAAPPDWPYLGPAGYLLENNDVAGFPQEDPAAVNIALVVPAHAKEWLSYLF